MERIVSTSRADARSSLMRSTAKFATRANYCFLLLKVACGNACERYQDIAKTCLIVIENNPWFVPVKYHSTAIIALVEVSHVLRPSPLQSRFTICYLYKSDAERAQTPPNIPN